MSLANSTKIQRLMDGVGMIGSFTCAVHCLLLPTLLVTSASLPAILKNEDAFHGLLLFVVIPSALIAFILGCRRHRDVIVIALGSVSVLSLLVLGIAGHDLFGEYWERVLMVGASSLLITAHVRNYWLCRSLNRN